MHIFHRSSTYVTPELAPKGRDIIYTEEQQKRWVEHPGEFLQFWKKATHVLNTEFMTLYKDKEQKKSLQMIQKKMAERLSKKPELIAKIVPNFALGCRR